MPRLIVVHEDGRETAIEGPTGSSLMELMRDHGVEEIHALCGGCCACATCHVWVDPEVFAGLPAMSSQEDDMLDCVEERRPTSRLSCQLALTESFDGIRVHVVS